jgi:hypothetical protein
MEHIKRAFPHSDGLLCSPVDGLHAHPSVSCLKASDVNCWSSCNSHIHCGSGQPVESIRTDTWALKALEHSPAEWRAERAFIKPSTGGRGGGGWGFRKQMLSRKASTKLSLNYTGYSALPSYCPDINQDILRRCLQSQVHSQSKSYLHPPPRHRNVREFCRSLSDNIPRAQRGGGGGCSPAASQTPKNEI